ncbi:TetR/AcrR family transcriptional regulator [Streptomycetaceae bacterium NBC_01309]
MSSLPVPHSSTDGQSPTRGTSNPTEDATPRPSPKDRSRRPRAGDKAGRAQILQAAVSCILELGFYRASTNEIARRAGVSWGSIQYYFGSRERLMLAVVEDLNQVFTNDIRRVRVEGGTLGERIASLYGILARHYGDPAYMARMQIVLNLQHDPDTSHEVTQILSDQAESVAGELGRLLTETLGEDVSHARRSTLFHAIRGFVISQQFSDSVFGGQRVPGEEAEAVRVFLANLAAAEESARPARERRTPRR